ncbi:hypothetical protein [Paenibacillus flagellatus]|uniref:Uncharacterized protein n=1 Tax=Paenibacillus flagellatus TaxID=2211139 RepID=A0A2V5KBU5_9BACL|nr:hypothetical protein [Paenibacillus flagellatus]PYI57049.1 hypothetical protein DLM86_00960 [Paenibacillus flagellatus]
MARDLEKDLAICEEATPGKWEALLDSVAMVDPGEISSVVWICQMYDEKAGNFHNYENNARFVAASREGWPYAIRRAMQAEEKVDRLENELRMLQDELNRRCGA